MIVISGCPRSGTSLMMDSMRRCFGEDRILGMKFPQERTLVQGRQDNEDKNAYEARMYLINTTYKDRIEKRKKDLELIRDMNPNGFWECHYTVQGLRWHLGFEDDPKKIVKVVSQGLIHSDPNYVSKVIYMLREPHQVAKSQEKLRRMPFMDLQEERDLRIHTPEMFIKVTFEAALWLKHNPQVPVIFINFDDLIAKPDDEFAKIKEFLGEGDFSNHPVEPKLKRSEVPHKPHHLWGIAESMYESMCNQDYDSVIKCHEEHIKEIKRDKIVTRCLRLNETVSVGQCHACIASKACRTNFRKRADSKGVDWKNQPCMFKCLTEPDVEEHESLADSIANNSWSDTLCQKASCKM